MASPIVVVEKDLLRSEAYRTLPRTAILMLMDFHMKRVIQGRTDKRGNKSHQVLNNGEIEYTYSEAKKKGINKQTFTTNRDVLIERGFIDIAHQGSGGKKGDKTLYSMSDRWRHWGTDRFIKCTRQKDQRKGCGFSVVKKNIGKENKGPIALVHKG
jgi:hypothetical protein